LQRCISCGRNTKSFAQFPCPECSEKITRCDFCRENRNKYSCPCGFAGP
jgi:predicted RNA-binding Zn-ribbon protein involved in translation (DUF1610 family)